MRPAPRTLRIVTLVLGALLLANCGTISAFVDLQSALQRAGYSKVRVNIDRDSGGKGLLIVGDSPGGETASESSTLKAAQIAWEQFPRRFETVRVKLDGESSRVFDRAALTDQFGVRNANLDDKSLQADTTRIGAGVVIGGLVALLLCVALVVLVLVLVGRSNRRRQARASAAQAAWSQNQWGQSGHPPPVPPPAAPPPPPTKTPPGWG